MGRKPRSEDPYRDITKRLDILIAILLAKEGFEREEVARILGVSEKTVQRMFDGNWNKIRGANNGKKEE